LGGRRGSKERHIREGEEDKARARESESERERERVGGRETFSTWVPAPDISATLTNEEHKHQSFY
jgi:hypothetical protein